MIALEPTKEISQTSTLPINLSTSEKSEKNGFSFSELLKGKNTQKDDKVIQNGALMLSLDADDTTDANESKTTKKSAKNETILQLLKNDDTKTLSTAEPLTLNPKATEKMSTTEVKALVVDAKKYLETKILSSDEYKQSQIKELPKTLKGLVEAAKIIDLDVAKISIEEVQVKSFNDTPKQLEVKAPPSLVYQKENFKESVKLDVKVQLADVLREKTSFSELKVQHPKGEKTFEDLKVQTQHPRGEKTFEDLKVQTQHPKGEKTFEDLKVQTQQSRDEKISQNIKVDDKPLKSEKTTHELKSEVQHPKSEIKTQINEQKVQTTKQEQTQEVKQTPLFKVQTKTQHTTEELVLTKATNTIKVDERTPKQRADETLKLLLRGEKPQQSLSASMTADFSVATAKVLRTPSEIAPMSFSQTGQPAQTIQVTQTLEQMLRGDAKGESVADVKTDTTTTGALKADSFEVKLNEAKQMVKYLSSDVKTAIEDYKSPFTRIKVQLTPQKLGEIDLTVVQRGKNLHVNLSSNNTAINTLAMNINDLRVQLSNNGINNATFNFSNSQEGGNSASSQQQQRHNEQEAQKEYSYFDNEEVNEDVLDSLEIVVPQYI